MNKSYVQKLIYCIIFIDLLQCAVQQLVKVHDISPRLFTEVSDGP
jgi:hypothetical protein